VKRGAGTRFCRLSFWCRELAAAAARTQVANCLFGVESWQRQQHAHRLQIVCSCYGDYLNVAVDRALFVGREDRQRKGQNSCSYYRRHRCRCRHFYTKQSGGPPGHPFLLQITVPRAKLLQVDDEHVHGRLKKTPLPPGSLLAGKQKDKRTVGLSLTVSFSFPPKEPTSFYCSLECASRPKFTNPTTIPFVCAGQEVFFVCRSTLFAMSKW